MQTALDEMTSERAYDLIHCCVPMFGYYRFPASIPVTSDTHEVKFELLRRTALHDKGILSKAANYWSYRLGKTEEPTLWKRFDALIATTDVDRQLMVAVEPTLRPFVIENGAGDGFFERTGAAPEARTMVFTGLFTHPPNVQAIEYFLDKIFPLILDKAPDARIYVVGKSPPPRLVRRASNQVVVTGFVDDVRPYLERAAVFVIPLLSGGGIRGKALEAMAMGKPIVTTTVGVEGIYLKDRESGLFADTPKLFAESVIELFENPDLSAAIAKRASAIAAERYRWAAKGQDLDKVLRGLVASTRRLRKRAS
jgi:glycosyltransferase involved in cell wall biosynthesis